MFDRINGIPVHPLVVHAVVVLLPLAVLGTIAIAVRSRWRVSYGPLVVAAALVATVLCPVATSSGEELEKRVGDPGEHADLGETLVWFALALLLTSGLLVFLQLRQDRSSDAAAGTTLVTIVAIAAVIAGLAAAVQVYRVGDSGARETWVNTAGRIAGVASNEARIALGPPAETAPSRPLLG